MRSKPNSNFRLLAGNMQEQYCTQIYKTGALTFISTANMSPRLPSMCREKNNNGNGDY